MKKNIMMRLSALLLVAVLLTTCVISGTFAKYVTTDSAEDEARVAKWGVVITATDDGESKKVFDTLDNNEETQISVNKDKKLLAPGTKGQLLNVVVTGTPEVAVNVDVDFTLTLTGWNITSGEYMPLVFTAVIAGETKTYKIGSATGEYENIDALATALKNDIETANGDYETNYDLATDFDLVLSWEWAFDGDDTKDTALGDLATAPTLKVEYSISVSQID